MKGESTERCKVVAPNAFAYNPMRLNIGSIARNTTDHSVMVSPDYVVFQTDPKRLLPNYLDHIRHSGLWQSYVGATGDGSVRVRIYFDQLSHYQLPLPPLSEQQKIAAILTAVDDKLDVIARKIEATQGLKRGLMQTLFCRGVGIQDAVGRWVPHVEFKESLIGKIPILWNLKALEELSVENITYGVVQPGENLEVGVPLIRGGDIKGGKISSKLRTVSVEISNQFKRTTLCGGELLVSLVGNPGETAVVPDGLAGANIARQAGMIRTGSRAISEFIHCYLSSPAGKACLLGGMIGSAQQVINLKSLRGVYVPMPPEAERMKITSACQSIFAKLDALERKKAYYQTLKRGLMQKLLTGEWRVKLDSPTCVA
ncbi:restriction endonuclease subunit S [Ectopseudomonas composti]|uniref:restriction endonuclease subunit S n=1 Tax=Ectopseudomonas composti TaxID=658457 RepID=UPI001FC9761B|nr:restriction endonuclease subunit S [Pseudomonas composti]